MKTTDLTTLTETFDAAAAVLDAATGTIERIVAYRAYHTAHLALRTARERNITLRCDPHHVFPGESA